MIQLLKNISHGYLLAIIFINSYALASDNNGNNIDDIYESELASMFAPIIHYHENNPLFPMPVDAIYSEENFINNVNGYVPLPIDTHSPDSWKNYFENILLTQNINSTVYYNIISQEIDPGITYTIIQYWFYYPFNDASNLHEGDWEHIAVIVDGNTPATANPVGVSFHHHYILSRYAWLDLETTGNHPHIYVGGKTKAEILRNYFTRSDDCPTAGGYQEITGASFPHAGTYYEAAYYPYDNDNARTYLVVREEIIPDREIYYTDYNLINLRDENDTDLWWKNYDVYFGIDWDKIEGACWKSFNAGIFWVAGYYPHLNDPPKSPFYSQYFDEYPISTYYESTDFSVIVHDEYSLFIKYTLLTDAEVNITIKNLFEESVKTYTDFKEIGTHKFQWTFRQDNGEPAGNGWYHYNISLSTPALFTSHTYYDARETPVTFSNRNGGVNLGGTLTVDNFGEISSGTTLNLNLYQDFQEKTNDKKFENWNDTGVNYKHHDWNGDFNLWKLSNEFNANPFESDQEANYEELKSVTILSDVGDIEIRDPWWYDATTGEQPDEPFFQSVSADGNYEVFLDQDPAEGQYYSLKRSDDINVTSTDIIAFSGWEVYNSSNQLDPTAADIVADPRDPDNPAVRAVVFKKPGAKIVAKYEAVNQIANYTLSINNGEILTITTPANINFAEGFSFNIANTGKLEIQGTEAQPIIFTGAGRDASWTYNYDTGEGYDAYNDQPLITVLVGESVSPYESNLDISHAIFRETVTAMQLIDEGSEQSVSHDRVKIDNMLIENVNVGMVLGYTGKALIEYSRITDTNIGLFMLPGLGEYDVERSVIYNNDCGITDIIDEGPAGSYDIPKLSLNNCTFYGNQNYDIFLRWDLCTECDYFRTDYSISHSIFALGGGFAGFVEADYSLFYSPPSNNPDWSGSGNKVGEDPLFVNTSADNFELNPDSPCIDAGDMGNCDPDGSIADMGAYYFHQDEGGIPCDESAFIYSPTIKINNSIPDKEDPVRNRSIVMRNLLRFSLFGFFAIIVLYLSIPKNVKRIMRLTNLTKFSLIFLLLGNISAEPVDAVTEADYLIITHPMLDTGTWLDDLIALQEKRGFQVGVKYVVDGQTNSAEIKSWINGAFTNGVTIKYVLLAGAGANYIPSPIVDPPVEERKAEEEIKIDRRYTAYRVTNADSMNFIPFSYEVDVVVWQDSVIDIPTDDLYRGWPDAPIDVTIGRVPAVTSDEMQIFVNKLSETYYSQNQYAEWKNREIMLSQNESKSCCRGSTVDLMYTDLINNIPNEIDTVFLRSTELSPDGGWIDSDILDNALEGAINSGAALVHIFATGAAPSNLGNFYFARQENNLGSDYDFLNYGMYPLLLGFTCNIGTIQEPYTRPSVMKDLMFVDNAGIMGAFASTIQTTQWACREFSKDFHRLLNVESVNVIGELTKRTKQDFEPRMPARVWVSRGFVLYGDPSMPLSLYQYKDSDITENTTWQGSIVVKNPITLEAGNTLTIKPGTGIFFEPGAKIMVYGSIEANGTANFPIVFSRTDPASNDKLFWNGIVVYSGGTFDLDNVEIYGARYGLYSKYGSGSIKNSHFEENYFGVYLYHSDNVNISANEFVNNRYGTYTYYSDPSINNNEFSGNAYGIKLNRSSATIRTNVVQNSQYDGIYCSNLSSPGLSTGRWNDGSDPEVNNVISNNNRYGVYVSSNSTPDLGSYFSMKSGFYITGGFNQFDRGSGSYDIKSYNFRTIYAEVNWWITMRNYGNIDTYPTADAVFGLPVLRRTTGSEYVPDSLDILLIEADSLELDSAFVEAIQLLNEIINLAPDDPIVYGAVSGIVRNYDHLNDSSGLLNNLNDLHAQYPQNLAGITANDYSVTIYAELMDFNEALSRSNEVIDVYMSTEEDEEAAWSMFEQASIYESMDQSGSGTGLGKVDTESELGIKIQQTHQRILRGYTNTEAAYFLREMLGKEHPPETVADAPIPSTFSLLPAYPNPFNPITNIQYGIPEDTWVTLTLYDILGREVRTLVNSHQTAGYKSVVWDGKDGFGNSVASGVYIYRLVAGDFTAAKKLLLIR